MFMRTESIEEAFDRPENIDLKRNIILCTPSQYNIFKQNIDGTISLNLFRDENLSAGKVTQNGTIAVFDYVPNVKMSIPQGIKVNIDDPSFGFCYIKKIYPECEMYYQGESNSIPLGSDFTELPPYVILTDFKITFHIDIKRLRDNKKSFLLKKDQSIANIYFGELPHFKEFGKDLDRIIYIRNSEVYETFIDVF